MQHESPPEWLEHVKRLFTLTDATPEYLEHVRAEVRGNGNLAMSLYAGLAALEGSSRAAASVSATGAASAGRRFMNP